MKRRPFAEAADGALGVETLLPAALRLYHSGSIGLRPLIAAMTCVPAKLLGLPGGRLAQGAPADLCLADTDTSWVVDAMALASKSKNSPFDESILQGRALKTFVAGRCVYSYAEGAESL